MDAAAERYDWRPDPRVVALPAGAASAGITYDVPGATLVQVEALAFVLTTAAGGAARQVIAQVRDALGATVYGVAAPATQAGGTTVVYSFAPLIPAGGSVAVQFMQAPFIGARLPQNMTILVFAVSAGAGDLILAPRLLVRQWALEQPRE